MTVQRTPPLTGNVVLDPWRIRRHLELAGQLEPPSRQHGPTLSERILWGLLESEPVGWQREYATGPYRLDFYCSAARLAVEVDGGSHYGQQAAERDRLRDEWHRLRGIVTKRFSAGEVEREADWVLSELRLQVQQRIAASVTTTPRAAPLPLPAVVVESSGPQPRFTSGEDADAHCAALPPGLPEIPEPAVACRDVLPEDRRPWVELVRAVESIAGR